MRLQSIKLYIVRRIWEDIKMINITEMVSGKVTVSRDVLGIYMEKARSPVIAVWNVTNICNLKCIHCYASSGMYNKTEELSTDEAIKLIDDLKDIGIKILIFSGGEPLLRDDIFELIRYSVKKGFRTVLSTNGTVIDDSIAYSLKKSGVDYVGISIDGSKEINDWFRGVDGAYDDALKGLTILNEIGLKTGIRFTATKYTIKELNYIINLLEELNIPRICVYHLIPSGRGSKLANWDLSHDEKRSMIKFLLEKALEWRDSNKESEIETVGSPEDGVFIYLLLRKYDEDLAENAYNYLLRRGGDPSGDRLINIDHMGGIHPNQFWWDYTIGNIRKDSLKEILFNNEDDFLNKLRMKSRYLKGRCSRCPFKDLCNGFRLRALRIYGDPWEEDPGCYINNDELRNISIS